MHNEYLLDVKKFLIIYLENQDLRLFPASTDADERAKSPSATTVEKCQVDKHHLGSANVWS